MKSINQTSQNVEIVTQKERSLSKLFNVLGIFIFGGLALTILTTPLYEIKNFLFFIFGSAFIYYILVNIYFIGGIWRKIFYTILILLIGFSFYMIYYSLFIQCHTKK